MPLPPQSPQPTLPPPPPGAQAARQRDRLRVLAIAAGVLTAAVVAICAATGVMTSGTSPADNTASLGLIAGQDENDAPAPGTDKTEAGAGRSSTSGVRTGGEQSGQPGAQVGAEGAPTEAGAPKGGSGAGADAGGPATSEPETGTSEAGEPDAGTAKPGKTQPGETPPSTPQSGQTQPSTSQAPPTPVAKRKAHPFPALANLIGRAAPGLQAEQLNTLAYAKGDLVPVVCQQEGPKAYGTTIWDRTADGLWVSDAYVQTGAPGFAPGVPRC